MSEARHATDYIYMRSGKIIYPGELGLYDVNLSDIAYGLSRIYRFNGQTKISVLRHSLAVASFFKDGPRDRFLYALLHDAAEAYMMDVPVPLKRFMTAEWSTAYVSTEDVILAKFRVFPSREDRVEVARVDKEVVIAEMERDYHTMFMKDEGSGMRYPLRSTPSQSATALRYYPTLMDHELVMTFMDALLSRF